MTINKDTKLYGSFSADPGNNGCLFFNGEFEKNKVNAIYKSFYSSNIGESVLSAKCLGFAGFAVSAPYKQSVISYLDILTEDVQKVNACNTVVNSNGILKGYNTDWIAVQRFLLGQPISFLGIVGLGGFGRAVAYAAMQLGLPHTIITRATMHTLDKFDGTIFNATPIEIYTQQPLIDGRSFTETGKIIAKYQAEEQYKIYLANG